MRTPAHRRRRQSQRQRRKRFERWWPTLLASCPICHDWVPGIKDHFETGHTSEEVSKWNRDTMRNALRYYGMPLLRAMEAEQA
jgi:hypothetical protein